MFGFFGRAGKIKSTAIRFRYFQNMKCFYSYRNAKNEIEPFQLICCFFPGPNLPNSAAEFRVCYREVYQLDMKWANDKIH